MYKYLNNREVNLKKRIVYFSLILCIALIAISCNLIRIQDKVLEQNNKNETNHQELSNNTILETLNIKEDIFGINGNSQGSLKGGTNITLYGGYLCFGTVINNKFVNLFVDDNEKVRLLCFNGSCNHSTESCSAFCEASDLQYYKGTLYARRERKIIKLDGNSFETVYVNTSFIENFCIRDGFFYFSDDDGICRVNIKTSEKIYISEIRPCVFCLNVNNDKILFSSETMQLYSMNYDGSELMLLSNDFTFTPQFNNGIIYYRDGKNLDLIAMNTDTLEKKVIANNTYQMVVCKEALYYLGYYDDDNNQCKIYKYSYETGEISYLSSTYFVNFTVYDELDYILVFDMKLETDEFGNSNQVFIPYLIDKDGTNRRKIEVPEILNF